MRLGLDFIWFSYCWCWSICIFLMLFIGKFFLVCMGKELINNLQRFEV